MIIFCGSDEKPYDANVILHFNNAYDGIIHYYSYANHFVSQKRMPKDFDSHRCDIKINLKFSKVFNVHIKCSS